ncbi:interleukin 12 receptor, beta 2a, like isoform X2 [Notolabrus celidotus]|uniref:interleukin 12 receptor, beta 2a, like isoform X2 n=1 Tax=Notolabrus celidotus TaxID=1203425 RepID=UPI0014904426|nr:interleukin 12 receptor, beta 2a, like isoform X2 [Notolabrus celidotus]
MLRINLRCVLVVWVVILSESLSSAGRPAPPSRPDCFIPCNENCQVDIHCTWEPGLDPETPANYTLHWKSNHSERQHAFHGTSLYGLILRRHFSSHDNLHVWVQVKNQHGSVESGEATFNTAEIFKPPPPEVTWSVREPLEISWTSSCDQLQHSLGSCDVRHRTGAGQDWIQEGSFHGSFTFHSPRPCSVYEVQVRCACDSGLRSNWSGSLWKSSIGTAPVGELDVWRDCGISPQSSDCVLTWKELPASQACGLILGYAVRLSHLDSSVVFVNVSTAEHRGPLVCEEMKCYLNSSLKGVSSVSVSAYNAHGASGPSHLSVPVTGDKQKGFYLKMTEDNLTVSWNFSSVLSENLKEYVVQYKLTGSPLGQGLDWVRVSNSNTSAFLKGQFKRYKPYQVSLLTVSCSNLSSGSSPVQHLSSAIGFSHQGTPSRVPSFKVQSIAVSDVTLSWEPVPLLQQNGIILFYQIGVNRHNVYNVSSSLTSKQLRVHPGQEYEVWIRAVTAAGPGENTTVTFNTNPHEDYVYFGLVLPVVLSLVLVLVLVSLSCLCPGAKTTCPLMRQCFLKVPDPRNSHIFRKVKNQINDSSDWICVCEPHPKISLLEVVEIQSWAFKSSLKKTSNPEGSTRPADRDRSSQKDRTDEEREDTVTGDSQRTDNKYRAEAYSRIIDSDEEEEKGEKEEGVDCCSSSKELLETGYEKHFMPTAEEILEAV